MPVPVKLPELPRFSNETNWCDFGGCVARPPRRRPRSARSVRRRPPLRLVPPRRRASPHPTPRALHAGAALATAAALYGAYRCGRGAERAARRHPKARARAPPPPPPPPPPRVRARAHSWWPPARPRADAAPRPRPPAPPQAFVLAVSLAFKDAAARDKWTALWRPMAAHVRRAPRGQGRGGVMRGGAAAVHACAGGPTRLCPPPLRPRRHAGGRQRAGHAELRAVPGRRGAAEAAGVRAVCVWGAGAGGRWGGGARRRRAPRPAAARGPGRAPPAGAARAPRQEATRKLWLTVPSCGPLAPSYVDKAAYEGVHRTSAAMAAFKEATGGIKAAVTGARGAPGEGGRGGRVGALGGGRALMSAPLRAGVRVQP